MKQLLIYRFVGNYFFLFFWCDFMVFFDNCMIELNFNLFIKGHKNGLKLIGPKT